MLEGLEGEKRQWDWDKVREDNSIDFLGKTMETINYGLYTFPSFPCLLIFLILLTHVLDGARGGGEHADQSMYG